MNCSTQRKLVLEEEQLSLALLWVSQDPEGCFFKTKISQIDETQFNFSCFHLDPKLFSEFFCCQDSLHAAYSTDLILKHNFACSWSVKRGNLPAAKRGAVILENVVHSRSSLVCFFHQLLDLHPKRKVRKDSDSECAAVFG